jgi:hypothetical protein
MKLHKLRIDKFMVINNIESRCPLRGLALVFYNLLKVWALVHVNIFHFSFMTLASQPHFEVWQVICPNLICTVYGEIRNKSNGPYRIRSVKIMQYNSSSRYSHFADE